MIYTIGLPSLYNTFPMKSNQCISFHSEDYILILASGNRFDLNKDHATGAFYLSGIIPTAEQKNAIEQFLENGGTVITSMEEPDHLTKTLFFPEEVNPKVLANDSFYYNSEEDLVEHTLFPYDWLLSSMKHTVDHIITKYGNQFRTWEKNEDDSLTLTITEKTFVFYPIGHSGGRIVFTKLLKPDITSKDIEALISLLQEKKIKGDTVRVTQ